MQGSTRSSQWPKVIQLIRHGAGFEIYDSRVLVINYTFLDKVYKDFIISHFHIAVLFAFLQEFIP